MAQDKFDKFKDPQGTDHYEQEEYAEGGEPEEEAGQAEAAEQQDIAEGMLPNISLPVIVALGRSYMSIKEIIKLRAGQILELNKNPNEPVDLVVNGKVVARGELVDVEGRLAVRLVKIVE